MRTNVTPDTVRMHVLEAENRLLKAKLKAQKRDVVLALESLDRHRLAKPTLKISPPKRRRLKLKGDRVRVIISDTHGSQVDPAAASAMVNDLRVLDPHEIIHLGDIVNCGGFLAQHHVMGYVAETEYSYEQDVCDASALIDAVQGACRRLESFDIIEGNHDRRPETWAVTQTQRHNRDSDFLRKLVGPEALLRLKDRGIKYYRQSEFYDGLPVPGTIKRGKNFFWHGTSSAKDTTTPNLIKVGGNITFGHVHREQSRRIRPVATGEIGAWCPGCLCKLAPLWNHTDPNNWTHGYAVQLVAPSGNFLHINIPIIDGESLLAPLLTHHTTTT